MPKTVIYPRGVVSPDAKPVEELNKNTPEANVDDVASDTLELSLDEVKDKGGDKTINFLRTSIREKNEAIERLEKELERQKKGRADLEKFLREYLKENGYVEKPRHILYEFICGGETAYSTDYDEVLDKADDPEAFVAHKAVWNEEKQKWKIE